MRLKTAYRNLRNPTVSINILSNRLRDLGTSRYFGLPGNEFNDGDAADNTEGEASVAAEQQPKPTEMSVDPKTNEAEAQAADVEV